MTYTHYQLARVFAKRRMDYKGWLKGQEVLDHHFGYATDPNGVRIHNLLISETNRVWSDISQLGERHE